MKGCCFFIFFHLHQDTFCDHLLLLYVPKTHYSGGSIIFSPQYKCIWGPPLKKMKMHRLCRKIDH